MKLLALECAGEACSAALYLDGQLLQAFEPTAASRHSQLLLPMQASLLEQANLALEDLDGIACGHGPGSFTGSRIATALCQGLAYGAGLPAVAVSTLAALAFAITGRHDKPQALVCTDARMREVYWGWYARDTDGLVALHPDSLQAPETLPQLPLQDCIGAGNGWQRYAAELQAVAAGCTRIDHDSLLTAADIAGLAAQQLRLGRASLRPAAELQPLYLRNQVVDQHRPPA